jgi:hypothetical protein
VADRAGTRDGRTPKQLGQRVGVALSDGSQVLDPTGGWTGCCQGLELREQVSGQLGTQVAAHIGGAVVVTSHVESLLGSVMFLADGQGVSSRRVELVLQVPPEVGQGFGVVLCGLLGKECLRLRDHAGGE